MCDPVTMTALQVGSTIAGAKVQQDKYNANAISAKDAYIIKTRQQNLQTAQKQIEASQKKQDAGLKAMKSQGTAIAVAGGAGVKGNNIASLINDFERSEGIITSRIDQKLNDVQYQAEMQKLAYQSEAQSRINSVSKPSALGTALRVGTIVAGNQMDANAEQSRIDNIG